MSNIYEHDNSSFFSQAKASNIYNVMERYNIPRPIKSDYGNNPDIALQLAKTFANEKTLPNEWILHLIHTAKDKHALHPIAYYVLHTKGRNFTTEQLSALFKEITGPEKEAMVKKLLSMDPILSTLSKDDRVKLAAVLGSDNLAINQTIASLPVFIQREMLSYLPAATKQHLIEKIISGHIPYDNTGQKDILLANLLLKDTNYSPVQMLTALKKYSPESKSYNLERFSKEEKDSTLRELLKKQLINQTPKILMLFSEGTEEELEKYSRQIEQAADQKLDSVPQTPESKKFFESMVALNIDTTTGLISVKPGVQAKALLPLPSIPHPRDPIGARLLVINNNEFDDLGDKDNSVYSKKDPKTKELLADLDFTDVYDSMHELCHALKLRHRDEMFYDPKSLAVLKKFEQMEIPGFIDLPSKKPENVTAFPATEQQQRRAA